MNGNQDSWKAFGNPIVAIAGLILLGVLFLLFSAIVGLDRGLLVGMAKVEYARGLITYLFAVVTIGTSVLLVVSALTSGADEHHEKQFQRGKEILSLLLGVFGTIVGFYFGAEIAKGAEEPLRVASIHMSSPAVSSGAKFSVMTVVSGGTPPYKYGVGLDNPSVDITEEVDKSGWIEAEKTAPPVTKEQTVMLTVRVKDANGHTAERSEKITVSPPH